MKLKKLPRFKARNTVALNPLLKKGGVHAKQDVDVARMRERKRTRLHLNKTDWLNHATHDLP